MKNLLKALVSKLPGDWEDPSYRQFVVGIFRQWKHCGPHPLPSRPGHRRRQIAMEWLGTFVIGCSCGQVFWKRYPNIDTSGDSRFNPSHPAHR